jgi:thiamine transporter
MAASPPAPFATPPGAAPAGPTVAARMRQGVWANANPAHWSVHLIAEIGIALALSVVFGPLLIRYVPLRMPQGGSFSLEMVPLLFVAVRRGVVPGVILGLLYGCVQLLPDLQPYIYHPAQVVLDYPLAFAAVGLAGLVPVSGWRSMWSAVAAGSAARLVFHFLSGLIFFQTFAPSWEWPWLYALTYNLVFLVPEAVLTGIVLRPILKSMDAALPGEVRAAR